MQHAVLQDCSALGGMRNPGRVSGVNILLSFLFLDSGAAWHQLLGIVDTISG
jgi:hypothetical protein